jgi:limonene-1,2-epoxide hydrolase
MGGKLQSAVTKKWVEEYFKSFNELGAGKTFSARFAEDAIYKNPWGREVHGLKNIVKYMDEVSHHGNKIKETLTPLRILIDGDSVAVELVAEMLALEDVPDYHVGSLKKGEKIRWILSGFYKIRDGKIVYVQLYVLAEEWLRKWLRV